MLRSSRARDGNNRRQFLQTAMAYAAVGIAGSRIGIQLPAADSGRALAHTSPDAALRELFDGNRRFAADQMASFKRDLRILRQRTADKQTPFAAVLTCADSRVSPELVFDQSIGDIFVVRVAGNIISPEIIGSLEYAVAELGVGAVLVLGHTNCGAVKAAMKGDTVPGQISSLYAHLRPAVDLSAGNIDAAIQANARLQAKLLRTSSTVIAQALTAGTVKVAAGVYDLATGKATIG